MTQQSRADFHNSSPQPNLCKDCAEEYMAVATEWSPETGTVWEPRYCPQCIVERGMCFTMKAGVR